MFLADMVIFTLALYGAYLFRFDLSLPSAYFIQFKGLLKYVLVFKAVLFVLFGLYQGMWRYTSLDDYWKLLRITALQSLVLICFVVFRFTFEGVPRSIFVLDWILTLLLCSGLRLSIRAFFHQIRIIAGTCWQPEKRSCSRSGRFCGKNQSGNDFQSGPVQSGRLS